MTNLFICKRTHKCESPSGVPYYTYEELAPLEDLERVREALEMLVPPEYKFKDLGYENCPICGFDPDRIRPIVSECIEILEKMK